MPGLTRATFKGGYTYSFWKADAATGEAKEIWHNQPGDTTFATVANMRLAGDYLVFRFNIGGGRGGRGAAAAETPVGPDRRVGPLPLAEPDVARTRNRCC